MINQISRVSILAFLFLLITQAAIALPTKTTNPIKELSVQDFVEMSYKDYKAMSAEKLTIKDKIEFKTNKFLLKRALKKGTIDATASAAASSSFEMRWGSFVVGLLLSVLGLILVLIFAKKPKKSALLSALIGMGVSVLAVALL